MREATNHGIIAPVLAPFGILVEIIDRIIHGK